MLRNFIFSLFFFTGIIFISIIFLPSFILPKQVVLVGGKLMGHWTGFLATFVAITIGLTYGAVSGYFGGKIDSLMMRLVDILDGLPFVIFIILILVIFGRDIYFLFISIGAFGWLSMARIVRLPWGL